MKIHQFQKTHTSIQKLKKTKKNLKLGFRLSAYSLGNAVADNQTCLQKEFCSAKQNFQIVLSPFLFYIQY